MCTVSYFTGNKVHMMKPRTNTNNINSAWRELAFLHWNVCLNGCASVCVCVCVFMYVCVCLCVCVCVCVCACVCLCVCSCVCTQGYSSPSSPGLRTPNPCHAAPAPLIQKHVQPLCLRPCLCPNCLISIWMSRGSSPEPSPGPPHPSLPRIGGHLSGPNQPNQPLSSSPSPSLETDTEKRFIRREVWQLGTALHCTSERDGLLFCGF